MARAGSKNTLLFDVVAFVPISSMSTEQVRTWKARPKIWTNFGSLHLIQPKHQAVNDDVHVYDNDIDGRLCHSLTSWEPFNRRHRSLLFET